MYLIKDKMYLNPYRMKDLYNRLFSSTSYTYYYFLLLIIYLYY